MSPFQYMQIAVSDGFQFYQQAPVFFFRRGQCPGDDSLVIGCAMLSRMHVGCDCIFRIRSTVYMEREQLPRLP